MFKLKLRHNNVLTKKGKTLFYSGHCVFNIVLTELKLRHNNVLTKKEKLCFIVGIVFSILYYVPCKSQG